MDDLFLSAPVGNNTFICVSPLARVTVEECDATHLGGDFGYFIYELDNNRTKGGIQILAKALSVDAAMRLVDIFLQSKRVLDYPTTAKRRHADQNRKGGRRP